MGENGNDSNGTTCDISTELKRLRASVSESGEQLKAGRSWNESEHNRYMDFATEVATLKEMHARELRERHDATKKHVSEIQDCTKRFSELKDSVKTLRQHVRRRGGAGTNETEAENDTQHLADIVAGFHALPADKKLAGLLDDAAVLRLMLLAAGLGMLFTLGFFVEGFGYFRCRFVCAN